MFTVKHVEKGGRETLFAATDVHTTDDGQVAFGQEVRITTGKVYIMNESGKTVAIYDFDKKEQHNGR